jgi:hypothetical protein
MLDETRLEELTVGLNRELYAEEAGLPVDQAARQAHAAALAAEYRQALAAPETLGDLKGMALDGLAEAEGAAWDTQFTQAMDDALVCADTLIDGGSITWRNWKRAERELDAAGRRALFDHLVERSQRLVPVIEGRYAARRALYAAHGLTPLAVFAGREGLAPEAVRDLAVRLGDACREAFGRRLRALAGQVFGPGPAGPAELRALYLNRMYEPLASLFGGRDPMDGVRALFDGLGFSIENIPTDFEDRPEKYPGAFCFPVQTPGDVRVSVKPASPHHLADMLYHEFGHAVHFAGIDSELPFVDRYWIHSGTHEAFSTLFETLLGLPEFLAEGLGFDSDDTRRLVEFDRFKFLLTVAWGAAGGVTVCDAWLENLAWPEIERRFADYALRFTGVAFPPGFARLQAYVNDVEPYPLGYLIAAVRVAHWLEELQAEFGPRWWAEAGAGEAIRRRIQLGGAVRFPPGWLEVGPFLARWAQ